MLYNWSNSTLYQNVIKFFFSGLTIIVGQKNLGMEIEVWSYTASFVKNSREKKNIVCCPAALWTGCAALSVEATYPEDETVGTALIFMSGQVSKKDKDA